MKNNNTKVKKFGFSDKIGYMFGDFGNDFTFILSSAFLLKFYTDVMGVSAAVVGIVMMLARFVDAFTDVGMGRICDKSKSTKAGKFRPWILRMCAPVTIASFLMYQSGFAHSAMWFKILWLVFTYILWGSIFYTAINIPYGSMASALSYDANDRQSLSTFRTVGGSLAGLFVGGLVPMLVYQQKGGIQILSGSKFTIVAGLFSLLAFGCYLLCYFLTTERVKFDKKDDEVEAKTKGFSFLKRLIKSKSLIAIILASIVMLLTMLVVQSMSNYVFPNYYHNPAAQSIMTMSSTVLMLGCGLFIKPLVRKFGRKELCTIGCAIASLSFLIAYILKPNNVWVFVVLNLIAYLGLSFFNMSIWAMITDVIDDYEVEFGVREDATVYSVYSFARKLGQALSSGLTGVLLSMIGYTQATAHNPEVLSGIFKISTLIPVIGFVLLLLILKFLYPLTKEKVAKNTEILKNRWK